MRFQLASGPVSRSWIDSFRDTWLADTAVADSFQKVKLTPPGRTPAQFCVERYSERAEFKAGVASMVYALLLR